MKQAKSGSPNKATLKRSAEPATPLQNPRFSRKRQFRSEPSWAQIFCLLDPDAPSEYEMLHRQINEQQEVIEFANLERQMAS